MPTELQPYKHMGSLVLQGSQGRGLQTGSVSETCQIFRCHADGIGENGHRQKSSECNKFLL